LLLVAYGGSLAVGRRCGVDVDQTLVWGWCEAGVGLVNQGFFSDPTNPERLPCYGQPRSPSMGDNMGDNLWLKASCGSGQAVQA
jgi:hypothetical protein